MAWERLVVVESDWGVVGESYSYPLLHGSHLDREACETLTGYQAEGLVIQKAHSLSFTCITLFDRLHETIFPSPTTHPTL
jgi:hypothetical protein